MRRHRLALFAITALYLAMSIVGITWGLPSRRIDPYLFGSDEPWTGEKIHRLAGAGEKLSDESIRSRGADVDVDPVRKSRGPHRVKDDAEPRPTNVEADSVRPTGKSVPQLDQPINLTATAADGLFSAMKPIPLTTTDEDVARIYLRYRLYTYQPDEMITMMALAGMKPGECKLDPRLYQYGGLWIYPVGALIKLCGVVGLIDVRNDLVFYLDNPDEFGKFYVVARAYAAGWGLLGVFVVFGITRRLITAMDCMGASKDPLCSANDDDGESKDPLCSVNDDDGASKDPLCSANDDSRGFQSDDPLCAQGDDAHGARDDNPHITQSHEATQTRCHHDQAENDSSKTDRGPSRCSRIECAGGSTRVGSSATRAGLLAALLFVLMPVVVCMSHEGKPHLPGAVLMLLAAYGAMRDAERTANFKARGRGATCAPHVVIRGPRSSFFWMMCLVCGAAMGMVLSSWPVFVLIPLMAWRRLTDDTHRAEGAPAPDGATSADDETSTRTDRPREPGLGIRWFGQSTLGVALAVAVYLMTNPYVLINALTNRDVLVSNFGNSLAMYEIARVSEGLLRVLELIVEGATLPIVVLGSLALALAVIRRHRMMIPLVAASGVFFVQFVLIGAGKPAEYGRFGIFPDTALAIGAAILCTTTWKRFKVPWMLTALSIVWCALRGGVYLSNFVIDTTDRASRIALRRQSPLATEIEGDVDPWTAVPILVTVAAEPAPYGCPPLPFHQLPVLLVDRAGPVDPMTGPPGGHIVHLRPVDRPRAVEANPISRSTPISWANKPFEVSTRPD